MENETDLFKAAQNERAEVILIDLNSFEDEFIPKIKKLKDYCQINLLLY